MFGASEPEAKKTKKYNLREGNSLIHCTKCMADIRVKRGCDEISVLNGHKGRCNCYSRDKRKEPISICSEVQFSIGDNDNDNYFPEEELPLL